MFLPPLAIKIKRQSFIPFFSARQSFILFAPIEDKLFQYDSATFHTNLMKFYTSPIQHDKNLCYILELFKN